MPLSQEQRHNHSSDTPVAIIERVNDFELGMSERNGDDWIIVRRADISLPVFEGGVHCQGIGRYKACLLHRRARCTDPVLIRPERAWVLVGAAHALHQTLVSLPKQAKSEAALLHPIAYEPHACAIVEHFLDIVLSPFRRIGARFHLQHFIKGSLRTFDAR